jgi:hypothetical protein
MQLKPLLDLIQLQSLDHSPEKLVFTTPILDSNTSDSITPEIDPFDGEAPLRVNPEPTAFGL